jgi:hypothetical protein
MVAAMLNISGWCKTLSASGVGDAGDPVKTMAGFSS